MHCIYFIATHEELPDKHARNPDGHSAGLAPMAWAARTNNEGPPDLHFRVPDGHRAQIVLWRGPRAQFMMFRICPFESPTVTRRADGALALAARTNNEGLPDMCFRNPGGLAALMALWRGQRLQVMRGLPICVLESPTVTRRRWRSGGACAHKLMMVFRRRSFESLAITKRGWRSCAARARK